LKIIACIKQVPDSEAKVKAEDGKVTWGDAPLVINPVDEYAVEGALQQREALGGTVTALCVGPESAKDALKHALAMGADEAVLVSDPALTELDTVGAARVLAALRTAGFRRVRRYVELGQQNFISAEFESGPRQGFDAGAKNERGDGAKGFAHTDGLPRRRDNLTFKMVNIYPGFHRIFSARIFSASLSAISSGFAPLTISQGMSRLGGLSSAMRLTTTAGAEMPRSANVQTGISALEALRMPMNDG
jgi:hypothetical protein